MNFYKKKVLFFSQYSQENYNLAEELCKNDNSIALFLSNEDSEKSKTDYFSILEKSNEEFSSKSFILKRKLEDEDFILDLCSFIMGNNFDVIIAKGLVTEVWPINLIKEKYNLTTINTVLLLEKMPIEYGEFELNILNGFDYIFGMGPSCNVKEVSEKTKLLFSTKESSIFQDLSLEVNENIPLVLCDKENFEYCKEKFNGISVIDATFCPEKELCFYMNICNFILNLSQNKEISLLLKKIGKIENLIEDFNTNVFEYKDEGVKDFDVVREIKRQFYNYLIEEIEIVLEKELKSTFVEGFSIGI